MKCFIKGCTKKADRQAQKRKPRQTINNIDARKLTSFKEGVVELPARNSWLSPSSILGLLGKGARGLATGVDVPSSRCRGGEGSSAARCASERTNVFDVLVGAVTLAAGSSSSSPLSAKIA
jgi:hypothetical protein